MRRNMREPGMLNYQESVNSERINTAAVECWYVEQFLPELRQ